MGIGDSIPGVSGGTVAVITNIYEQLIKSISRINIQAVRFLLSGDIKQFWQQINGNFLGILAAGILLGLLISANTVLYLLANHFETLMAFFIGLVLASVWFLQAEVHWENWRNFMAAAFGFCLAVFISMLPTQATSIGYFSVFFSGMVAICAMILPGLSGAFILLILGVYEFILSALVGLQLDYIIVFAAGCGIGLISFTHLVAWLLSRYRQLAYGCISGMLLGSVLALWPWQVAPLDNETSSSALTIISPLKYQAITGNEPELAFAALSLFLGSLIVVFLHRAFNTVKGEE